MTDLERLTAAFHAMNPWAQRLLSDLAEKYAVGFPAPRPKTHLRLVAVGRQRPPRGKKQPAECQAAEVRVAALLTDFSP
ncbi:hypothetical protein CR105_03115 [Massilia eurypsychrophila]|uniref:Uncharacterized protein n=1 Tax=Massilia eurypsychrophila TaxID=1485217 RepID=A0A2G8TJ64_9BURK|nr:hypothetical protein CR105_03115 [Massilia eurypsychrophila]